MADICLTYLSSQQVKALWTSSSPDTQNTPFLEYCSVYWGVHAKRELSNCANSLSLELLKVDYCPRSTKLLLAQVKGLYLQNYSTYFPFSGLHCVSLFGIMEVVTGLIQMRCCDINAGDFFGFTPLAWAAHKVNGHEEVVKFLHECKEVDPDKPYNTGKIPLSHAASFGHEGVLKILPEREEVNPDKPNNDSWTPLTRAALRGNEAVVKILLSCEEVNADKPDDWGPTPLSYAASSRHERVVKILLEQEEVNPDKPTDSGRTLLELATENGHERVVALLHSHKAAIPSMIQGTTSWKWPRPSPFGIGIP